MKDPQTPFEARERICPKSVSVPLNPQIAALDPMAVAATLLPERGAWHRALVNPHATATEVEGLYTSGERQVRIAVRDMIHECTGEAATNTLLETESKMPVFGELALRRRVLSATSAVMIDPTDNGGKTRQLVMWIAGRCRVTVSALTGTFLDKNHAFLAGISDEDLAIAGRVVDVNDLEQVCAARAHL